MNTWGRRRKLETESGADKDSSCRGDRDWDREENIEESERERERDRETECLGVGGERLERGTTSDGNVCGSNRPGHDEHEVYSLRPGCQACGVAPAGVHTNLSTSRVLSLSLCLSVSLSVSVCVFFLSPLLVVCLFVQQKFVLPSSSQAFCTTMWVHSIPFHRNVSGINYSRAWMQSSCLTIGIRTWNSLQGFGGYEALCLGMNAEDFPSLLLLQWLECCFAAFLFWSMFLTCIYLTKIQKLDFLGSWNTLWLVSEAFGSVCWFWFKGRFWQMGGAWSNGDSGNSPHCHGGGAH